MICNDFELGINAYDAGDFNAAADYLTKAIASERENWQARLYLARCYKHLNQHQRARRSLRLLIEHCPTECIRELAKGELVVTAPETRLQSG